MSTCAILYEHKSSARIVFAEPRRENIILQLNTDTTNSNTYFHAREEFNSLFIASFFKPELTISKQIQTDDQIFVDNENKLFFLTRQDLSQDNVKLKFYKSKNVNLDVFQIQNACLLSFNSSSNTQGRVLLNNKEIKNFFMKKNITNYLFLNDLHDEDTITIEESTLPNHILTRYIFLSIAWAILIICINVDYQFKCWKRISSIIVAILLAIFICLQPPIIPDPIWTILVALFFVILVIIEIAHIFQLQHALEDQRSRKRKNSSDK